MAVGNIREKVSVSKQAMQKFDMQRFNLKKLMTWKIKNNNKLKFQIAMQFWKTLMIMWTSVEP
jgi:hypothetical protein